MPTFSRVSIQNNRHTTIKHKITCTIFKHRKAQAVTWSCLVRGKDSGSYCGVDTTFSLATQNSEVPVLAPLWTPRIFDLPIIFGSKDGFFRSITNQQNGWKKQNQSFFRWYSITCTSVCNLFFLNHRTKIWLHVLSKITN